MVNRQGPIPLYQQVADELRSRIRAGTWPPHYKLKAEPVLAEEFEISRGTVRQALQSLVREGLLTQAQGKGTFVTAKSVDLPLAQELVTMHELLAETGQHFTTELLEEDVSPGSERIRRLLDVPPDESLLRLRRRLVVEGEPFVVLENWIRLDLCPELRSVDFTERSLFDALENLCGLEITWGQRHFSARKAGRMAELLAMDQNNPVLYIEQITYLSDGSPLEYSDVWVRADKLRVSTILTRSRAAATDLRPSQSRGV